jgi:phage gpG-like protein
MKFSEAKKIVSKMNEAKKEIEKLVTIMGTEALNHFTKSFRDQGFTDESWEAWKRRKNKDSKRGRGYDTYRHQGTDEAEGKRFRVKREAPRSVKNRAILVRTGELRRSLQKRNLGRYSVVIKSDKIYANVHNEGLRSGRGGGFTMKKRQFVGYSEVLNRRLQQRINIRLNRIFK